MANRKQVLRDNNVGLLLSVVPCLVWTARESLEAL